MGRPPSVLSSVLSVLPVLAIGCGERQFGTGIGRPPLDPIQRPALQPLTITEVHAGDGVIDPFVELAVSDGTTDVPLGGLWLCSERADCVNLEALQAELPAGDRLVVDAAALELVAGYGEVAVVDGDLSAGETATLAHAHLAWGGAPPSQSPLTGLALVSGAYVPGAHVDLPFPMPPAVAVAREDDATGCAAPSPGAVGVLDPSLCAQDACDLDTCVRSTCDASQCDPASCAASGPPLWLTEVAAGGGRSWVTVQSCTADPLPLYGVRICQPPDCARLGPGDVLPGAAEPGVEVELPQAAALRAAGEVAVLAPGGAAVADAQAMLAFLSYGDGDLPAPVLGAAATDAGLWSDPEQSAPAPTDTEILTRIDATAGPAGWTLGAPASAPPTAGARVFLGPRPGGS